MTYVDIIEVNRDRNSAYVCAYSGVKDEDGHDTWATNYEVELDDIEFRLGYELPNGYQEPWIRIEDYG